MSGPSCSRRAIRSSYCADLTVDSANDAFYKSFERTPDVTEGRSIFDLLGRQRDIPRLRRLLEKIIPRNGFFNDFKITREFSNLGRRALILNARRLDVPVDGSQRILLGIEDVTKWQLLDESVKRDEDRFRALALASAQLIWTTTPDGLAEEGSPSWSAFTGQTFSQCIGKGWLDAIHPDDHEVVRKTWLDSIAEERLYEVEYRLRRPDGVYRWMAARAAPVFDVDGSIREWIGVATDITERKEAEQAQARLAAIVESSSDAIIAADLDGVITNWNQGAERLYGYTAQEAVGQSVMTLIPPELSGEGESVLERLRRGERFEQFETVSRRKDGSDVPVSWTISPNRNARGEVISSSGIARDITERKRAEEAIRAAYEQEAAARAEAELANRLKDEFLATVSHELRSPLNAILGWTSLLSDKRLGELESARALEVIRSSARAQNQLISDLLDVSRIITGKSRLEMRVVELPSIIEAAMDVVRPTAEAKKIRLVSALDSMAGPVSGDSDRLQQIAWNLLSNAVKFTPAGGQVKVSLEREGASVKLTVSDTGEGIEPEFLHFVFDRFRQFESTPARAHGGLGLGLAIARHLVELHGGTISVASRGRGQGATFIVTLPLAFRKESGEQGHLAGAGGIPQSQALSPDCLRNLRVLVADDEPVARDLISLAFTSYGAEVRNCASATEALQILDEWQPDALVFDIGMPDEDGYDLMRKVRAREPERGGRIPAIALTAYARAEDASRALDAGYQRHIPKPVEPVDLARAVASLARRGRDD